MERRAFLGTVAASSAAAILEQPGESTQTPQAKPTTVTLLGTGTPAPSLDRAGSGYLIEVGNDKIVMDHGPDAHHRLLESGRRAVDITHAVFTHLHYDHCMDYGRLVLQRWDQGADKIPDLDVYGPPPIARMTGQLFGAEGVYGPDIMNHNFSGTAPSPAYRAACGNHKDNAEVAQRAGVKTLVLTHLLAQIDHPRIREQIVHEIQQVFSGKVVWGEDLMRLTFAGPIVASIEGY